MKEPYTAVIKHSGAWWIGWIEEDPGLITYQLQVQKGFGKSCEPACWKPQYGGSYVKPMQVDSYSQHEIEDRSVVLLGGGPTGKCSTRRINHLATPGPRSCRRIGGGTVGV